MVQNPFFVPALAGLAAIIARCGATTTVINAVDLAFEPTSVTASPGDVLEFHFQQFNHSVAMGDFNSPCMPASKGGFFSGFWPVMAGENGTVFRVTINDTNPIVYYCSQPIHSHCQSGMIGFINSNDTAAQNAYINAAKGVSNVGSPADIFGGVLAANPNASAVAAASSSAAGTTASPTQSSTSAAGPTGGSNSTSDAAEILTGGAFKAMIGSGIAAWMMAMLMI